MALLAGPEEMLKRNLLQNNDFRIQRLCARLKLNRGFGVASAPAVLAAVEHARVLVDRSEHRWPASHMNPQLAVAWSLTCHRPYSRVR